MARVPTGPDGLIEATRALHARLRPDTATPMSPDGFHQQQGVWAYEPPAVSASRLYVAPEVATLDAPPGPVTERYEAAMLLRCLVEGERDLERRFLKSLGTRSVEDVFARLDRDPLIEVPRPNAKAYRDLGRASEVLGAMTRRDPTARPGPETSLLAVVEAVNQDPPPEAESAGLSLQIDRRLLLVGAGGLALGTLAGLLLARGGTEATENRTIHLRAGWDTRDVLLPAVPGVVTSVLLQIEGVPSPTIDVWTWADRLADEHAAETPPIEGRSGAEGAWHRRTTLADDGSLSVPLAPGAASSNRYLGSGGADDPRPLVMDQGGERRFLIARLGIGATTLDLLA